MQAAAIGQGALEMPASHAEHTGVSSTPLKLLIGVDRLIIVTHSARVKPV